MMLSITKTTHLSIILSCFILLKVCALPHDDIVETQKDFPGQIIYSGFLATTKQDSKLHYVFIQSQTNFTSAPIVVWLNGGPQCSSLFNMMTSVGPYIAGPDYKPGDKLVKNDYSWNRVASMLYIDTPGIVGFSTDKNYSHIYNDEESVRDLYDAVLDFYKNKAPELKNNDFYIAGVSYGGVKAVRLAAQILVHNLHQESKINLKGILIGNGVIHTSKLELSRLKYLMKKDFVDIRLKQLYQQACRQDFESPRCKYVRGQIFNQQDGLSPFNVYVVCKAKNQQKLSTSKLAQRIDIFKGQSSNKSLSLDSNNQIPDCHDYNSTVTFWNSHIQQFHVAKSDKKWQICATSALYQFDPDGVYEYYKLFSILMPQLKIWLYSGDWDAVVPLEHYFDTLYQMGFSKASENKPWFYKQEHAGFYQAFDNNMTVISVKGAGHIAVQNKQPQTYQMFYNFIKNRPINTPVF